MSIFQTTTQAHTAHTHTWRSADARSKHSQARVCERHPAEETLPACRLCVCAWPAGTPGVAGDVVEGVPQYWAARRQYARRFCDGLVTTSSHVTAVL